ncbi:MAG: hypothetical protein HN353_12310 [Bdellovibrionales bacterium]|jgi:hypothetical protein|nr:hypothetical protein [Bdellovibrionales bacterium]MBT3526298.1 hypothetical protein [Bdellovibrionales bacterium]MBT7668875.1 hypothetical protein [Bdellovibrionales bacterium]MBT7767850.1 hypothetical protein [Bdellovibrionales bacterium]
MKILLSILFISSLLVQSHLLVAAEDCPATLENALISSRTDFDYCDADQREMIERVVDREMSRVSKIAQVAKSNKSSNLAGYIYKLTALRALYAIIKF